MNTMRTTAVMTVTSAESPTMVETRKSSTFHDDHASSSWAASPGSTNPQTTIRDTLCTMGLSHSHRKMPADESPPLAALTAGVRFNAFSPGKCLSYLVNLRQQRRCGNGRVPQTTGRGGLDRAFYEKSARMAMTTAHGPPPRKQQDGGMTQARARGASLFPDAALGKRPWDNMSFRDPYPLFPLAEITIDPRTRQPSCVLFRVRSSMRAARDCWHCCGEIPRTAGDTYGGFPFVTQMWKRRVDGVQRADMTITGEGFFCSPACTFAYINNDRGLANMRLEVMRMTRQLLQMRYGIDGRAVRPAPPRNALRRFGGKLTLAEFRGTGLAASDLVAVVELPRGVDFVQHYPRLLFTTRGEIPVSPRKPLPRTWTARHNIQHVPKPLRAGTGAVRVSASAASAAAAAAANAAVDVRGVSNGSRFLPTWSLRNAADAAQDRARAAHTAHGSRPHDEAAKAGAAAAQTLANEATRRAQPKMPVLHRPSPPGLAPRHSMAAFLSSGIS